jgi:polyribonucleotide nucleotidyltransferase
VLQGLTLKPALKAAAKANKIPKSFEEVKKDETFVGVIKKITSFGVIVRFMNHVQGLSIRMVSTFIIARFSSGY